MYPESYTPEESGLQRLVRVLSKSLRIGQFFGVELRVYWLAIILMPAYTLYEFGILASSLGIGTVITLCAVVNLGLFFIIYTHEMGHIAAGWRYGIHTPLITIGPMGGLAHMGAAAPRPSADVVISLAGPAVHLVWLVILAPFYFFGDHIFPASMWQFGWSVYFLCVTNVILLVFNLLPCYPMDGGRVLRALLAMRIHPNRATVIACRVGQVGGVAFGIAGLFMAHFWGLILICIGITNFMACRRAIIAARHEFSPYGGDYREAWQQDPDAWKQGGSPPHASFKAKGEQPRKPGWFSSWRKDRREKFDQDLEAELDRLLIKIKHLGMDGLTPAEKKTLHRASKQARKKR